MEIVNRKLKYKCLGNLQFLYKKSSYQIDGSNLPIIETIMNQ